MSNSWSAPRVLLVTSNFPPDIGGIETYSLELARCFGELCEAFAVLAPRAPGSREIDRNLPFEVHRIPRLSDNFALSAVWPIARLVERDRFDIAYCAHWSAAHAALRSRSRAPVKVVCAAHGCELLLRPLKAIPFALVFYDRLRARVLQHADVTVANSHFTAGLLQNAGVPIEPSPRSRWASIPRSFEGAMTPRSGHRSV